jgi:thiosulfate/3-mercaptopyruvate sulfurtransferase
MNAKAATPLIDARSLQTLLAGTAPVALLDCGFDLTDPTAGERAFAAGHLPGAAYVHLDRDLSGPKTGHDGRHPLPARSVWAATMGRLGVAPGVAVVVYDDHGGVYASRAWWMLRWAGHTEVALLDGGRGAWRAAGGALVVGDTSREPAQGPYPVSASAAMGTVDTGTLAAGLDRVALLDARAPERYRGEVEPLDPVAGRIPGARNRFFKLNLGADGCFRWCTSAARASRPATTCWPWRWPGSMPACCTRARGAPGAATPRGPWRAGPDGAAGALDPRQAPDGPAPRTYHHHTRPLQAAPEAPCTNESCSRPTAPTSR